MQENKRQKEISEMGGCQARTHHFLQGEEYVKNELFSGRCKRDFEFNNPPPPPHFPLCPP